MPRLLGPVGLALLTAAVLALAAQARVHRKPPYALLGRSTLQVRGEVRKLAADGSDIAVLTSDGCDRFFLWHVREGVVRAVAADCSCDFFDDLALAGGLAAWLDVSAGCSINTEEQIRASRGGLDFGEGGVNGPPRGGGEFVGHLVGRGHLLAWNAWHQRTDREATHSGEQLEKRVESGHALVAMGPNSYPVVDTDGSRFLVARDDGPLKVLNGHGSVVLSLAFPRRFVDSAKLRASTLAVLTRSGTLLIYNARTGARLRRYAVPPDATLADLEGQRVVYVTADEVHVRDIRRNRDAFVRVPAGRYSRLLADLGPQGLVVTYQTNDDEAHTLVRIVRAP